jgi:integral membrane protein
LFRRVAVLEACTWALLLVGMFLKYVTKTTEVGVQVAGPIHGVAFVAYCVTTVVVGVDQRWTGRRLVVGLLSSIPPFVTVVFDRWAERHGALDTSWRLRGSEPRGALDRPVALLVRRPLLGLVIGLVVVAVLTVLALLLGPPGGS